MSAPDIYTRNLDAMKALRSDSVTGWISPEGIVHIVPLFNHLGFFVEHPNELPQATEFLSRFMNQDGSLSLSRPHMAEAMDLVYLNGWGRIGTYGGDKIELDCSSEHLKGLRRSVKVLGRMLNRGLVCNVPPPLQKPARKRKPLERDAVWSSLRPGFVGWLSPGGTIHETPPNAPFAIFTEYPDLLPETAKAFEDAVAEDGHRQRDGFVEYAMECDPDGHIGWHRFYEMPYNPPGDERLEMTLLVLSHGWGALQVEQERVVILQADAVHAERLAHLLTELVAPAECTVETRLVEEVRVYLP